MAKSAKDRTLILHIGLHKTATSYLQNVLSARRDDLLRVGVLYPRTGAVDRVTVSTRDGAQSGHALLALPGDHRKLVSELLAEIPDTASTVLLSSEDFTRPRADPEEYISRFSAFGSVQVVLVLRRQDVWIESYYKQIVDQYGNFETRSFDEFVGQMGSKLLDFHTRFSPWRDLVRPESFHVLSYDDLPGGAAICRRLLEIAGVGGSLLDDPESIPVPRYDSVRAIDTLGLRILNSYRLENRDVRTRIAKSIYAAAPDSDIDLMTPEMREGIQALCAPINERIEAEWFKEPVPGFRFGAAPGDSAASPPTAPEVVEYVDQVISLCEGARKSADESGSAVDRKNPLSARLLRLRNRVIGNNQPTANQALQRAKRQKRRGRRGTPPPEVVVEQTNLGPEMDELVAALRRRQKRAGVDADYDLLRDNFDHLNFALQARAKNRITPNDPISVYLRNGAEAVNNPDINFSMSAYLARYPEKRESDEHPYLAWVKHGKAAGEIADPAPEIERMARVLDLSPIELVDALVERRTDLQQRLRTGKLGEMFARAAEVDPLVGSVWPESSRPVLFPVTRETPVKQMAALHASHVEAGFSRARVLLVVRKPRWGGGRRMEGHIAHALAGRVAPEEIVVIYTEEGGAAPTGRFPDGVREIDFAAHTADMEAEWQEHTLVMLLRSFQADSIVNVNSGTLHRAMRRYGSALAATERVFPIFFCNEQDEAGNWYGWPSIQFYRLFDQVTKLITDSEYLAQWFEGIYQLDAGSREKVRVFHAPVDPTLPVASRDAPSRPSARPTVFWAGRWDRQKKIDVVLQIARLMPDVEFRMWGEAVLQRRKLKHLPDNVTVEGKYAAFTDLNLGEADVWLYTSAWDGVPTILLEVAMTGVPIVGSLVGGTGEVLDEEDAWPVAEIDNAEEYVKAIREVLADTAGARQRALALRERLLRERSRAAFAEQVTDLLLVDGEGTA